MKNSKLYTSIIAVILFFAVLAVIYMQMIEETKKDLLAQKYKNIAISLQNRIHDMVVSKQKATLSLALTLVHTDEELPRFIQKKEVPQDYYKDLLIEYKKYTLYKNIWIQVIDKYGTSLYRSWSLYRGDNLAKARDDIKEMIHKPKIGSSLSVGKFDLSIKAMVPIYQENRFIGIVEVISHLNSIARQLHKNGIESVVLADKKYKKQLRYPFTRLFIDDYYVANKAAKPEYINYLKKHGVEKYLKSGYKVENGYFIVTYPLKDHGKVVGTYITFQKLDDVSVKNINDFVMQWILFGIVSLMAMIGFINIILYIILRKQKQYYQKIVDGSTNIVLVNDEKQIIEANKTFFKFFTEYKTIDDFTKQHKCICEYFVVCDGYITREMDGLHWVEYVKRHPEKDNKIKMRINDRIYYFLVSASLVSEKPLRNAIILSDITKEEVYKHELEKLTITDPLTGMKNRRYYEQSIAQEISRACRYKEMLSVILFDIDHFKRVNDVYGHDVGDDVLVEYSALIKSMLRDTDELCRIGGEEFIIIAPHTPQVDAYVIAEKIRKAVEEAHLVIPITISFGVAQYEHCEEKDNLFKRADNALYKAKSTGRNKVVLG